MERKSYKPKLIEEDIVISGISGRFPESGSIDEFADNLFKNVNMVTENDSRWSTDLYAMNHRMGKLKEIDKFDGEFFGISKFTADKIEEKARILIETTYEAIIDAGINPQMLRGSNTGVYIGLTTFGINDGIPEEIQPETSSVYDTAMNVSGMSKSLYPHRVSFEYDFKGPSIFIDTACSASLVALNYAINDMRFGKCDQAIVGGTAINLHPFYHHSLQIIGVNTNDGIPKVWDERANGYVKSECVSCIFLQKKSDSKRIYATLLNSGINIDGYKKLGIFYPSGEAQEELMCKVYEEANIDPLKINYVEAHATGTSVGDAQEAKAIYNSYCAKPKRDPKSLLPIGLLKSNMGHSEGASGMPSIVKVILAYEKEIIPSCLHLNDIKYNIRDYCPPLFPVRENMKYTPGIASINNFGIGGVNANVILEPNYKTITENNGRIADIIPRLVHICGRTPDAFDYLCKWIEDNPNKTTNEFLDLLSEPMKYKSIFNSTGFPIRGSLLIKESLNEKQELKREYKKQSSLFNDKIVRPLWFVFPGLGGQWVGMAKPLMNIKIFADKLEECHQILKPNGIDLKYLLLSDDPNTQSSMTNKFCATTSFQICLTDVLTALNIIPDGIIGHSFGEIACAYADGCLTTEGALKTAYIRGFFTESNVKIPKGLMAFVGLSWDEAKELCPNGVFVVCNNGKESVVISGLYNETKQMIEELAKKGVFVRELQSLGVAYHSPYLRSCVEEMRSHLNSIILTPKLRSKKWVSTAFLNSESDINHLKFASADYFIDNLLNPVYFYDKLKSLPMDAIVVEVGPHPLFSRVVTETLENSTFISLIKRNETNVDMFLSGIAKLYELGLDPNTNILYPKVNYPVVRGTQSISSLMKWDHSESYFVKKWPEYNFKATASDMIENLNFNVNSNNYYILDHIIDGRTIFPATGYLLSVWRQLAAHKGKIWNQIPVVFEEVQFKRAVFISAEESTKLIIKYFPNSGDFSVEENGDIVCVGRISSPEDFSLNLQNLINENPEEDFDTIIEKNDIYKELRIMGYDYGSNFRGLRTLKTNDFKKFYSEIEWKGKIVSLLDNMMQTMILSTPIRKLCVPVMIKQLRCVPTVLYEAVALNKQINNDELDDLDVQYNNEELDGFSKIENLSSRSNLSKFYEFESVLPCYNNTTTNQMVLPGIELEGLVFVPIPRVSNLKELKLESYEFIANEDNNSIEKYNKSIILEYLKVCSAVATNIYNSINKENDNIFNDLVLGEMNNKYMSDGIEEHILLKVLNEIHKQTLDKNQNINEFFKEFASDLMSKPENDLSGDVINLVSRNERLIRSLLDIVIENIIPKRDIKVMEINLTNCLFAEEMENHLSMAAIYPIEVEYNIVVKDMNDINLDLKKKSFKIKEWDYKQTNFPSDIIQTNLIIIKDSIHLWDLRIDSFLQKIYDCLTPNGFLISVFRYRLTEPEIILNKIIGKKVSKNELKERIDQFVRESQNIGFNTICRKCDSIGSVTLLFRKVMDRNPTELQINNIIEITLETEKWFERVKQIISKPKDNENKERIWLIASDSIKNGIIGLVNCLRLEPGGETIRCIFNYDDIIRNPINFKQKPYSDILINDLAVNIIKDGKLGTYRYQTLPKDYDKTFSDEYYLNIGPNKDISKLQWYSLKNMSAKSEAFDVYNRRCNLVKCMIYSSGINFKDVMLTIGRISSGLLSYYSDCFIGCEFAGRRVDTGERVFGCAVSQCFATSIDAMEYLILPIPDNWSMDDSVTIFFTYLTVWYSLVVKAHIERGEKILIHSGAGGVGQAAINVCKYYGCDVFVTVGTEEKKKFLMNEYNIPDNRIFSSRDIQFKYKIKELTEGKGVDIVLNSLSGDKFDASFQCLSICGRFVEIGKYDIQMNKKLGMYSLNNDISFIGVSIDLKLVLDKNIMKRFSVWIKSNSNNGMIKPLNRTIFRAEEAEKAFRYMTTGKHIGKLIIKIREEENTRIVVNGYSPSAVLKTTTKTFFDENKVYIITGGLGGMGLELVHWMLYLGARKFILTSRTGVKNNYQKFVLNRLKTQNLRIFDSEVIVSTQNLLTIDGAKAMIAEAMKLGPIGGVFHLALVLNDSLLENKTIDKFNETIDTKIKIFENLDKISRDLCLDLDYFVVFSSIVSGYGNVSQSDYGYANSVCERICEIRKRDGLNGQAIQWGPVGDVGILAENEIIENFLVLKQRIHLCFEVLDKLLQSEKTIITSFIKRKNYISLNNTEISTKLCQYLGIDLKKTPDYLTIGEFGMESIIALQIQHRLEKDFNVKFPLNEMKMISIGVFKELEFGNTNGLTKFAEEIKIFRNKMSKTKFIIPTDPFTKLNNINTGKALYILPPLNGFFTSLEEIINNMERPVIGLNWVKDIENMSSVEEITNYFIDLLKGLHPNGDYDIVGHSYNALIIVKMIENFAPIRRAVIIDLLSDINVNEDIMSDEYIIEEILTTFVSNSFPQNISNKIRRDISNKTDINSKLIKISDELKEFIGKSVISRDLENIIINSFKRAKLFLTHIHKSITKIKQQKTINKNKIKMSGKLLFIKPLESKSEINTEGMIEKIIEFYFSLKNSLDEKLEFEFFDCNPLSITSIPFDKLAHSIINYLNK